MFRQKRNKTALLTALSIFTAAMLGGCGIFSGAEEEPKIEVVVEDVSSSYQLGKVELHDVSSTIELSCT